MTSNKSNYNKSLKHFARELRNESTLGEIILWKRVFRAKQVFDYTFNRQFSMKVNGLQIIVDFICRELKLVVEIDGYAHKFKHKEDQIRDQFLLEYGYRVLRFSEQEVRHRIDEVVIIIDDKIREIERVGDDFK